MNTLAFYNSLLSRTKYDNLDSLTTNEAQLFVDALNRAITRFHRYAPDRYRMRQVYVGVRAPVEMTGTFTNGSTAITAIQDPGVEPAVMVTGAGVSGVNTIYVKQADGSYRPSSVIAYPRIVSDGSGGLQIDLNVDNLGVYGNSAANPWQGTWTDGGGGLPVPTVTLLEERLPQSWYGSAVFVDGDEIWNRLDDEGNLEKPYAGESGTKTFRIYGDAVPLDGWSVERVYAHPILASGRALEHDTLFPQYGSSFHQFIAPGQRGIYPMVSESRAIGTPIRYSTRPTGSMAKGLLSDSSLIVLDPIPSTADALRIGIVHNPVQFALSSIQEVITIPVPDHIARGILFDLAVDELSPAPFFTGDRAFSARKAQTAEMDAGKLSPYSAPPNHHIGTPWGF